MAVLRLCVACDRPGPAYRCGTCRVPVCSTRCFEAHASAAHRRRTYRVFLAYAPHSREDVVATRAGTFAPPSPGGGR